MAEAIDPVRHTGAGVARRQAFHERQRAERAQQDAAGAEVLPAEADDVSQVSAAVVLDSVAESGPNYSLLRSKENKKDRRKRQREAAEAAQLEATAGNRGTANGAQRGAAAVDGVRAQPERATPQRVNKPQHRNGVMHSALAEAFEEDEDEEEAALGDEEPMLSPHGYDLSQQLVGVRRRLRTFLAEQAAAGKTVSMQNTANGQHPTMRCKHMAWFENRIE